MGSPAAAVPFGIVAASAFSVCHSRRAGIRGRIAHLSHSLALSGPLSSPRSALKSRHRSASAGSARNRSAAIASRVFTSEVEAGVSR